MDNKHIIILTRVQAKALGLARYFTGEPCKHGHIDERQVRSQSCMQCQRDSALKQLLKNPEKMRERNRLWALANSDKKRELHQRWRKENPEAAAKWRLENPEKEKEIGRKYRLANTKKTKEANRRWRTENKDYAKEQQKLWRAANPDKLSESARRSYIKNKDSTQIAHRKYRENNPGMMNAISAKHRAAKLQATPSWADNEQIAAWYRVAEVLSRGGVQFHVDHIVPLMGKYVRGLHSHDNLQVIPWFENMSKSNKFPPGES